MRLTALQWETCFCDLLSARGFSSAFTDEKASLFASLFRALDKKDPEDLFSADVLPVPAAVLTKSLCKPEGSLSPTAVFAALDVLAQAFCSFSGPSACLHFALPDPEPVVQLPDASSVKKTVDAYRSTPAYLAREEKRRALFDPTALLTEETLARQLRFIREAYGLTLRNEQLSLQRLARTDFRQAVLSGSLEILSVLAQCFGGIKNRSAGKFAERYCSCYMPVYYPVCDRDTAAGLRYYRDGCGFYPFLDEDLENPRKFRRVLLLFRQKYALTGVTNADAAEYLACIGQNTVDIKEAHS